MEQSKPKTALQLMRSRFSAYATNNVPYLLNTSHPELLTILDKDDLQRAIDRTTYTRLEVVGHTHDTVEFKAYYVLHKDPREHCQHELSKFIKVRGNWTYHSPIR